MSSPQLSRLRTRTCKKCGGKSRTDQEYSPADACPSCGAIYAKVEQVLEAEDDGPRPRPIGGWHIFFFVITVAAVMGTVLAALGLGALVGITLFVAFYLLHLGKKHGDANSPDWLVRFVAQPKTKSAVKFRAPTLKQLAIYAAIYAGMVLLFFFVALPLIGLVFGGPR